MDGAVFWLFATMLMLLHQYQASALLGPTAEREGPAAQLPDAAHRREKRCSCENQKDKECIFFCHIGIVWVNTPSHVVPYGFGSVRLRRNLSRCLCADAGDTKCDNFCSGRTQTDGEDSLRRSEMDWRNLRDALWEKRSRHALRRQT